MTLIAAVLLLAGTLLAAASVTTYVDNAWHDDPDWETMRIARVVATGSRRAIITGLLLWLGADNTAGPIVTLGLLVATAAALLTYSTAPGKLTIGGRPVA